MKNIDSGGGRPAFHGRRILVWAAFDAASDPVSETAAARRRPPRRTPEPDQHRYAEKTSESMMRLNQALEAREQRVAAREQTVKQREDEIGAERAALDPFA